MKTTRLLSLLLLVSLPFLSFKPKATSYDDGYYAFIVVDGIWKNNTGYVSRIIYYPGYTECNRNSNVDFFSNAKRAFSDHLKAYYNDAFPTGENNNFELVENLKYSTSTLLKTRAQAEQRLTEWIAEQKEKGYAVRPTSFGYSCNN